MNNVDLAPFIDHTLLKPDVTEKEINKICQEAIQHRFATVCVNPGHITRVTELLRGSSVKPITVVGFPLGTTTTQSKVNEARQAVQTGAQEIDMVLNGAALKDRDYALVFEDIDQVVRAAHPFPVKVILETASLTEPEKIIACALAKAAKAAFVKTSTGFGAGGATVSDIELMRRTVGPDMGVKASGGIRSYQDAIRMIEAGANRIGASNSVKIIEESREQL